MLISRYIVEFIIFSFLGWIWETIYCTICNGKWESRGFLFGPVCPIYGVGALSGFVFLDILSLTNREIPPWWAIFLIGVLGSAVLEYGTSVVLEKLFHAYWWDYSKMPLNINGRICLPASLAFGAVGLLVVYVLYPLSNQFFAPLSGVVIEIIALIFTIVFTIDMTLTITSLTDVLNSILRIDENINERMTERVDSLYKSMNLLSKRVISRVKGVRFKKPAQAQTFRSLIERIKKTK